ncbi:hypothetical protein ABLT93_12445 [Acinetobacter soli]|uniref:hypothetical protein n=1 Tax=Acinetobacter soli TaxID=487316 RepID=UPI0032B5F1AF
MYVILSLIFLLICCFFVYKMLFLNNIYMLQLGVISVFSIGYFCLPIFFIDKSPLNNVDDFFITEAVLIFLIFFIAFVIGFIFFKNVNFKVNLKLEFFDHIFFKNRIIISIFFTIFLLYYYSSSSLTSYSSDDFEDFFSNRGGVNALLSLASKYAIAWIALNFGISVLLKDKKTVFLHLLLLVVAILPLFFLGQRLVLLTPFILLVVALGIQSQFKAAKKSFSIAVLVLLLISPLAVFIRQSLTNPQNNVKDVITEFKYTDGIFETILQSIIDRGDLIYVTTQIKPILDNESYVGFQYYYSVLSNPIPKFFFSEKPYPLSPTGLDKDELSIKAWKEIHSNTTGSLTAFGGLVAYRELGWLGLIFNGFFTGFLFVFVYRLLGMGGITVVPFYLLFFVEVSVKKVPASFWESLLVLMPYIPILLFLFIANSLLIPFYKKGNRNV